MPLSAPSCSHPLDPLVADELATAIEVLRAQADIGPRTRFISAQLHEPAKDALLAWQPGGDVPRLAEVVLFDRSSSTTSEALVDLRARQIVKVTEPSGVQPALLVEEYLEVERLVRDDPRFIEAAAKRGVTNLELVCVDPVPAGAWGFADEVGRRVCRAIAFVRPSPGGNQYARPLEGILALVDLDAGNVVRVEDRGSVALPEEVGEFRAEELGVLRSDVKPLRITQPD